MIRVWFRCWPVSNKQRFFFLFCRLNQYDIVVCHDNNLVQRHVLRIYDSLQIKNHSFFFCVVWHCFHWKCMWTNIVSMPVRIAIIDAKTVWRTWCLWCMCSSRIWKKCNCENAFCFDYSMQWLKFSGKKLRIWKRCSMITNFRAVLYNKVFIVRSVVRWFGCCLQRLY